MTAGGLTGHEHIRSGRGIAAGGAGQDRGAALCLGVAAGFLCEGAGREVRHGAGAGGGVLREEGGGVGGRHESLLTPAALQVVEQFGADAFSQRDGFGAEVIVAVTLTGGASSEHVVAEPLSLLTVPYESAPRTGRGKSPAWCR